ncbi:NifU family protein [Microbispora sp. RL4-1S]|uniref:NifU family protein n=1 Tax=Microbispora oryzae TaxID=2806554 RepID=A0A940WSA3_9ACTN|nr:NifU family protein [Microbispora oryzae]MBP2706530.1 NifU family protein [Microbispora oryzae]
MPRGPEVQAAGERVEALVGELGALADPVARARAEELVRVLVELYGTGLEHVMTIVTDAGAGDVLHGLIEDELVSGLLVLHDLHPLTTEERVRIALDEVRPYLGSHEGGVELLGVDRAGVVRLRLEGTCHGCPSSRVTVTQAIERAITKAAPEVVRVDVDGVDVDGATAPVRPLLHIAPRPPGPCPVPEEVP